MELGRENGPFLCVDIHKVDKEYYSITVHYEVLQQNVSGNKQRTKMVWSIMEVNDLAMTDGEMERQVKQQMQQKKKMSVKEKF